MNWKVHPVAEMFPMIPEGGQEWFDLVESIRSVGQVEPVVVDGDVLLDGRNRVRACECLGIKPRFVDWRTLGCKTDQVDWIRAKNIERRHLTPDQKATICWEIEGWVMKGIAANNKKSTQFESGESPNPGGKPKAEVTTKPYSPEKRDRNSKSTVGRVAKKAGVSFHKVRQFKKLSEAVKAGKMAATVIDDVKSGKTKLADALKSIAEPKKAKPVREQIQKWLSKLLAKFPEQESEVKTILREIL